MRDISSRGTPIFSGTIVTTGQPHEVTAVLKGMEGMPPLPVIMPSSLPTGFVGEGSRGVPQKGQRFIGALEDTVIIILTYLNTPGSIDSSGVLDDEHIEYPGEFSLRGPASSLLFKGSGEVSIDAGMNVKQIFDKVTGRISTMAKTFVSNTIGNFSEVSFTPGDFSASGINKNTSTYVNVQRKTEDSNLSGDDNKALEDPPGMGPMPYVDKVIIKSGHLTGGLLKQDLGHIYELRTQQGRSGLPLTATTGKSVLTELRLGKQNNQTEYLTPTSGGTIISLKGKDILGAGDPIVGGNKQSFVLR
ncbi:hypothetical protein H8D85_01475 [bacterium]|nr:hypothetical protein [bacterium]